MEYHLARFTGRPSADQLNRYLLLKDLIHEVRMDGTRRGELLAQADIALPRVTHPTPKPRKVNPYQLPLPNTEVPYMIAGEPA